MYLDDENNELVVTDDVPETSEENVVETDASEEVNEVQNTTEEVVQPNEEDVEKRIQEEAHKIAEGIVEKRLIRDRAKRDKEQAKFLELESIMKSALGANDIDEIISKSREFYKEQGIQIPDTINKPYLTERQETVLAKDDAKTIIDLGKEEMEEEAKRIAAIPESQRSFRDKIIFNDVCQELVRLKDEESFKSKGYDTSILQDKDFVDFRKQFTLQKPVSEVYEMYQQIKGTKPVQPYSPGSAKTNTTNNEIKDYYTPEEVRQFTEEDLDNPKLMEAIDRSMLRWGKTK